MGRWTGWLTSFCLLATLGSMAVGWSGVRGGDPVGTILGIVLSGGFGLLTVHLIVARDEDAPSGDEPD
ncbi:hypothetical protein [Streptomyces aidingensis]|uniref:Uncharacterized protein n=1 Tax=Streptomyces aidingensis TaxID=910347 RepID=A0A1I1FG22_9ACTN|nr:hypothetical protein [Streptomyces aidingensis]SFB96010.1 hypothetical protein SAMN05421773_101651 [Streptomyces aidingensis]